jgi:hypothetical protein
MIKEDALAFGRGELVDFVLHLGGGKKRCRGLVLNTAVLFGRAARQIWIVDMDNPTPQQQAHWTNRKHIVYEEDIVSIISSVLIGRDTLLRDNPICYPVQDAMSGLVASPALTVTVAIPAPEKIPSPADETGGPLET